MQQTGLIADIGATNARFAMADESGFRDEVVLQCLDYPTIVDAVRAYQEKIQSAGAVRSASFAIAGPVSGDVFTMTNHGWTFSIEQTRRDLGLDSFHLHNDFAAVAMAIPAMKAQHIVQIGQGKAQKNAPIGVIGPGTGLGVAGLVPDGRGDYIVVPSEGGHVTMPAKTQREFSLFEALHGKYHHISAERVCSGKGLVNVYDAIRLVDKRDDLPERTPEEISTLAVKGQCEVSSEVLDLMLGFLGTVAGNLALSYGAHGGIYIAGGIPAKLGDYFLQSRFRQEFESKGRMSDVYMKDIPTFMVTDPYIAFTGLQADLVKTWKAPSL
jgi:glucokinase